MKRKTHLLFFLTFVSMAALLSLALSAQTTNAGGGIILRPPFSGTYRVTAYFRHFPK